MHLTNLTLFSPKTFQRAAAICAAGIALSAISAMAGEEELPGSIALQTAAADDSEDVTIHLELIRRRAMLDEADELIRMGGVALDEGRAEEAMQAFGGVRDMLPDAPATEELREQATEGFVESSLAHAEKLAAGGDLDGARQVVDSVLAEGVAPGDPDALKLKQRLNQPIRHNPARTTDHVADVEKVVELLQLAQGAYDLGQFDRAEKFYERVIVIDPYNKTARRGMEQVVGEKRVAAALDHTRAEMLMEVDKQWELPLPPTDEALLALFGDDESLPSQLTIREKFERIMIPRIAFDQVSLDEAIDFLRVVSIREDKIDDNPDTRGINFTINLSGLDAEAKERVLNTRFDLRLSNVPVSQVVKYITNSTRTTFRVDDYSVVIRPPGAALDELISRTYQVPPDFVTALSAGSAGAQQDNPFADEPASGGLLAKRKSVLELLKEKGVGFPDGAIASHSPSSGVLRVVNTPKNQDTIAAIVEAIKDADPVAVSVQVTVLKIQEDNLRELGFDWLLGGYTLGGGDKILGGGTRGSAGGRVANDFSNTISGLPTDPLSPVENGVITSGLRSGDQIFNSNTVDDLILNPNRSTQAVRAAPGILSVTGVFNDGTAQAIMRGLDQKTGVDMMANPSVVTRSHQSAKILIAKEFIYPTEYDPPEIQGGLVGLVTPANPTAFETRNVGITLEVLPEADEKKNYINLTLSPELVEFDGFVNYGSPINSVASNPEIDFDIFGNLIIEDVAVGGAVRVTENRILMPIFSTQRATTSLTIADGATIAYGGLLRSSIETVNDSVPILGSLPFIGRFFQSNALRPQRTAVVFFVRVQLMDPTGRPYRELSSR